MLRLLILLVLGTVLFSTGCFGKKAQNSVPGMPIAAPIPKDRPAWTRSTEPETKDGKIWIVGRSSGMQLEAAAIRAAEVDARGRFAARVYTRINRKAQSVLGHEMDRTNQFFQDINIEASSALAAGTGEDGGQLLYIERSYRQSEAGGRFEGYVFDVWICMNVRQDRFKFAMQEALDRVKRKAVDEESRKVAAELEKDIKSGDFEKLL